MIWLMGLTVCLLVVVTGFLAITVWLLWCNLQSWQDLRKTLRVYDQPEFLAQPLPEPGTTWLPSDREVAALESTLLSQSRQRAPAASANGGRMSSGNSTKMRR